MISLLYRSPLLIALFQVLLAVLICAGAGAMVGSSFSRQPGSAHIPQVFASPAKPVARSTPFDLSSGLISQLAIAAIKARLKAQTSVTCDVTTSSSGLMFGTVGPCTVAGKHWQSGLGLTCRAIEATVDACELDTARVITNRKLVLRQPATGHAMIALDSTDFGNFLTHPLVKAPHVSSHGNACNNLHFLRDQVSIDPIAETVNFFAMFDGGKWSCALRRGNNAERRAVVTVTPAEGVANGSEVEPLWVELSEKISEYFNTIVFELDGTFVTFRDMMVTSKGASPSVMLSMGIKVKKFPSRNLAF